MRDVPLLSPGIDESALVRRGPEDSRPAINDIRQDAELVTLFEAAREMRVSMERVASATPAILGNQMATSLYNQSRLRELSFAQLERGNKRIDAARNKVAARLKALEAEIASPAVGKDPAAIALATEIRAAIARLPNESARKDAIAKAVRTRDDQTVAAVLSGAPAMLSGLDPETIELYRGEYQRAHYSEAMGRIAMLKQACADLDGIGRVARSWVIALSDHDAIKDAMETEAKAKEAIAAASATGEQQ